jgi:hypothetical protein
MAGVGSAAGACPGRARAKVRCLTLISHAPTTHAAPPIRHAAARRVCGPGCRPASSTCGTASPANR